MFLDDLVTRLNYSIFGYKEVLEYLETRCVYHEDIRRFGLGYGKIISAQNDGSQEYEDFKKGWYNIKLAERVLFPIRNALGSVVGLIGRSTSTKTFKIFATKEAKFQGLFIGLSEALPHINKENRVYVVEGPFDWAALVKVLPNTVSSLTAGLSEEQNWLLKLFCDRVVTVFDDDPAGKAATDKTNREFGTESINLGYGDPNRCLQVLGLARFKNHVLQKIKDLPPF